MIKDLIAECPNCHQMFRPAFTGPMLDIVICQCGSKVDIGKTKKDVMFWPGDEIDFQKIIKSQTNCIQYWKSVRHIESDIVPGGKDQFQGDELRRYIETGR